MAYIDEIGKDILNDSNVATLEKAVQTVRNQGYNVGTQNASGDSAITGVRLDTENISINADDDPIEVGIELVRSEDIYYAEINGTKYEITDSTGNGDIKIEKTPLATSTETTPTNPTITPATSDNTVAEVAMSADGTKIVVTPHKKGNVTITATVAGTSISNLEIGSIAVTKVLTQEEVVGGFINYNVPYTDAYYYGQDDSHPAYTYNNTNGWRILNLEQDGNGKYNIKIISTGIPARVYYHYDQNPETEGNANKKWWGTTAQVLTGNGINEGYYKDEGTDAFKSHNAWTGTNGSYSGYYAAYGFKFNFAKITFNKTIPSSWESSNYNLGYYHALNGETGTLDEASKVIAAFSEKTAPTGRTSTISISEIREIDGTDIDSSLGNAFSSEPGVSISSNKPTGLFQLNQLRSVNKASTHSVNNYTYSGEYYWLATPSSGSGWEKYVWRVSGSGFGRSNYSSCGVRPVISLSGVDLEYDSTTDLWNLE
ncbi:MAG: hypothetical protein ILA02_04710 [Clostridia bacterium]|nr:hypothetical protein [Clostridia bacterium]